MQHAWILRHEPASDSLPGATEHLGCSQCLQQIYPKKRLSCAVRPESRRAVLAASGRGVNEIVASAPVNRGRKIKSRYIDLCCVPLRCPQLAVSTMRPFRTVLRTLIVTLSLAGAIADDFPLHPPVGVPRSFWRLPCRGQSGIGRLDPIMSPGKISSHVHVIYGSNGETAAIHHRNRLTPDPFQAWLSMSLQSL